MVYNYENEEPKKLYLINRVIPKTETMKCNKKKLIFKGFNTLIMQISGSNLEFNKIKPNARKFCNENKVTMKMNSKDPITQQVRFY